MHLGGSVFAPNTSWNASSGVLIFYYFTNNFILKLCRRFINQFAQPVFSTSHDPVPHRLHCREGLGEPFTVTLDSHHHKLFNLSFTRRPVLNKVTLVEVCNFQLKLNLWEVVLRHLWFNLPSQWALDFNEEPILGDAVG